MRFFKRYHIKLLITHYYINVLMTDYIITIQGGILNVITIKQRIICWTRKSVAIRQLCQYKHPHTNTPTHTVEICIG